MFKQVRSQFQSWRAQQQAAQLNPFARFPSMQAVQAAAQQGHRIDVNQATVDDWLRLPGISIRQARALVQLTQSGVRFYQLEDLAAALGVAMSALTPLAPILQFCYYDPASPIAIQPVNANLATVEQLLRIPAMDLYLAQKLVGDRQQRGRYANLAELQQRLALPATVVADLLHWLCFA